MEPHERRLRIVFGLVLIAVAVVAVVIAIANGSSSPPKPHSKAANHDAATVEQLLTGIPQTATTLGNPRAPVTVTEFGDLECSVCQAFALGPENQIISSYVRTGEAKLVYRSLCSATCNGPHPSVFPTQQGAAYAAGAQDRAWDYIELFYHEQGTEGTGYVTEAYLDGLALQIPGLVYSQWKSELKNPSYLAEIIADKDYAHTKGYNDTPTVIVSGPKGEQTFSSLEDYGTYQSAIKSVS